MVKMVNFMLYIFYHTKKTEMEDRLKPRKFGNSRKRVGKTKKKQ